MKIKNVLLVAAVMGVKHAAGVDAVAAVQRGLSSPQTLTTTPQPVAFSTTELNVGGLPTSAGSIGTASVAGVYDISGALTAMTNQTNGAVHGYIAVNGVMRDRFYQQYSSPGAWEEIGFSSLLQLNAGDVVSLYAATNGNSGIIEAGQWTTANMILVPEPAMLCLLSVAAVGLLSRRRSAA